MAETFNPPATREEAHAALDACLSKALTFDGDPVVWLDRYEQVRAYAEQTWPGEEFAAYEPCPGCQDMKGVACDICDRPESISDTSKQETPPTGGAGGPG